MAEKLCLQWNDFKENITASFGNLRHDEDFADVTLACEDGKQVEAHKWILASSPSRPVATRSACLGNPKRLPPPTRQPASAATSTDVRSEKEKAHASYIRYVNEKEVVI